MSICVLLLAEAQIIAAEYYKHGLLKALTRITFCNVQFSVTLVFNVKLTILIRLIDITHLCLYLNAESWHLNHFFGLHRLCRSGLSEADEEFDMIGVEDELNRSKLDQRSILCLIKAGSRARSLI